MACKEKKIDGGAPINLVYIMRTIGVIVTYRAVVVTKYTMLDIISHVIIIAERVARIPMYKCLLPFSL